MFWQTAIADHMGGRLEQQDRVSVWQSAAGERCLVVLADGMGGHQGGAIAAQAVMDCAANLWTQHCSSDVALPAVLLKNFCVDAHEAVKKAGEVHDLEPHSTCVVLYIQAGKAWLTHLGDSRFYWFHQGRYQRRSKDHSIVQMLLDMGRIKEEEMATHPDQGCLLKGLGGYESAQAPCEHIPLAIEDSFLLCSDGLWEQISVEEMAAALTQENLSQSAEDLVKLAAERGGERGDNIAVALIRAC